MVKTVASIIALLLAVSSLSLAADEADIQSLSAEIAREFSHKTPSQWGETVSGVRTRLATGAKVVALTLDACGSPKGKGVDQILIDFLVREKIPTTLFINARWVDANPDLFLRLAANPLFEIANHGIWHKPASIAGRSVYGIEGTRNVTELVQEIELNARKLEGLTGKRPRFYRSGTAYYDEYAVQIAQRLGHEVVGFAVLGDKGASYSGTEVEAACLRARPGDIIIAHMNHPEAGTGAGLMAAVPKLQKRGFRFVSLAQYPLK